MKQTWPRNEQTQKIQHNYIDFHFYWRLFPHQFLTDIVHKISHQTGKSDRITMNFTSAQYLGLHFIRATSDQKVALFTKNESQSCFVPFHRGLTYRLDSLNCVDVWGSRHVTAISVPYHYTWKQYLLDFPLSLGWIPAAQQCTYTIDKQYQGGGGGIKSHTTWSFNTHSIFLVRYPSRLNSNSSHCYWQITYGTITWH